MTHSRTPHKDKSDCYFIPAGEAFSPACFVMPFFSCANFAGLFSFQLLTFVCRTPRIKDIWRQKSTAQAIVVPCSAEDSLALGGRNGYNIPAVQSLCCFGRCVACCRRWGAGNTLPLPCYFVFIVIIPLVDRPCNPHRAIARGGKKFQFAWNRQECPRWTFLFFV